MRWPKGRPKDWNRSILRTNLGSSNTWHRSQGTDKALMNQRCEPLRFRGFLNTVLSPNRSSRAHLHLPKYCPAYKPSEKLADHSNQKPTLHPGHELLSNLASFFRLSTHISLCHVYLHKYESPCPTPQLYPYFPKHSTTSSIQKKKWEKKYFGGVQIYLFKFLFKYLYIFYLIIRGTGMLVGATERQPECTQWIVPSQDGLLPHLQSSGTEGSLADDTGKGR